MLQELSIKNFAIIDDLHISFSDGLTILSGETGAGKSIIINAVNLILGSRATARLIRTGAESAEIEALFQIIPGTGAAKNIQKHGYDASEGLLIKRIISRNERHKVYINGHIATIQILNIITENLASISGQHAHQGLLNQDQHLLILDQFGGLIPLRTAVYRYFHETRPLIQNLNDLDAKKKRQSEHIQLLQFQKKEIVEAAITHKEDTALELEIMRLKNVQTLYKTVHDSIRELYSAPGAVLEQLSVVKKNLDMGCGIDPELSLSAQGINETTFRIEDIIQELRTYLKSVQTDDNRLDEAEQRLDFLHKMKRKYGKSLEDIVLHLKTIDRELSEVENISENIEKIKEKLLQVHDRLVKSAMELSIKRKAVSKILASKVEEELSTLKMPQTRFRIVLRTTPADDAVDIYHTAEGIVITETGIDTASFMIAPNIGEEIKPLASIVSGGELSRVVLALKALLADTESVETIVFDEVDAGIGGEAAEVVGKKLHTLADRHQVICITHLPQIAKFGEHHFIISKLVAGGRTKTAIIPLDEPKRINEIARMLGGAKITTATLEHAREMLTNK